MLNDYIQYVPNEYYANLTAGGLVPNPVTVVGWNGDGILYAWLSLITVLVTLQTLCLVYMVVKRTYKPEV